MYTDGAQQNALEFSFVRADDKEQGDPIKLFVGQVPKKYNEEDLSPLFEPFGPVLEIKVLRDKFTHNHKGN